MPQADAVPSGGPAGAKRRVGAYGLVLDVPESWTRWWNDAPAAWTPWSVVWEEEADGIGEINRIDAVHATLVLRPDGYAVMDRPARHTTLRIAQPLSMESLLHPHLGSTAVVHAYWEGWDSFHGGAFLLSGKAWVLLGDREHGKSSALAWLHARGFPIVADDLAVVRDATVMAGPRCMDLRRPAVERFSIGHDIGVVGTRRRWRVQLSPVAAESPLGGWMLLRWSADGATRIRQASLEERFSALSLSRGLRVPVTGCNWLDLVSLPTLVFERPKDWDAMDAAMDRLLAAAGAAPARETRLAPGDRAATPPAGG